MADKTWKQVERRFAALFGVRRRPLSGGNQGGGRDDAIHDRLFLECKHRARSSLWTLYRETSKLASKEGKVPVLGIHEKGAKGILVVVHSDHLKDVLHSIQERTA